MTRKPDIKTQIVGELYAALEQFGATPEVLAIVRNWRDTLDDDEIPSVLQHYNDRGKAGQTSVHDRTSRSLTDPQYWRDRAEEARVKGAEMKDTHNRHMMLRIAEGHERQAELLEQRALRDSSSEEE